MTAESSLARVLRLLTPYVAFLAAGVLALFFVLSLSSCQMGAERPAASLSLTRDPKSPSDATVTIDEEYIGPLGYVGARGVKLPAGKHRITIEKPGYFPWDRLVEAGTAPIHFDVVLEPIPD